MLRRRLWGARLRERAGRSLALAATALLLAACTRVEIEDHSLQFNQAAGSLSNRMMLLNVVRAAKGYSIQFSKVTSYSGSSRTDGGLNLNFPFVGAVIGSPNSAFPGSVAPNATLKTGVNQLQLADLNTAEFQRTLRKKVTANDFAYYRSQGWPSALVQTLLIEEIFVEPGLRDKLIWAAKATCNPDPDPQRRGSARNRRGQEQENNRVCDWLLSAKCIGRLKDERASPDGDVVYAYRNDPRNACHYESFQWFFAAIRVLPGATLGFEPKVETEECTRPKAALKDLAGSAKDGKSKSKDSGKGSSESIKDGKVTVDVNVKIGDKADKDDDSSDKSKDSGSIGINLPKGLRNLKTATIGELPALERLRNENVCLLKEGKTPILVSWRSPERMVRYLGEVLAVQGYGSGNRTIRILGDDGRRVELLRVESARHALGRAAAVAVEGPEGESVYIPIPDRTPSGSEHLSLQALALVMEAVNLAISGKELPRTTTFFLSGG